MPISVVNELSPSKRLTLLLDESPLKGIPLWLWGLSTGGALLDGFVLFALGVATLGVFLLRILKERFGVPAAGRHGVATVWNSREEGKVIF